MPFFNQQPRPEGTRYVVLIRYLYSGFNTFLKRPKARTRERAEGIKPLNTNKKTPGIENVSHFENFCKINGRLFKINITVKKMLDKNRYFVYYYAAARLEEK